MRTASRTAVRAAAAATAVLVLAALAPAHTATATTAETAETAATAPPVPRLHWDRPCAQGFECATAAVPTDYRDPRGTPLDLALIRHRATDTAHRIGSLFFNPGGPGIPGTAALPAVYGLFPEQVRRRFDIVSFDPRGTGASTTLHCFPDPAAEQALLDGLPAGFPTGTDQQTAWTRAYTGLARHCADNDTTGLLAHLSTADTARDLDVLRQAVGDRRLTYLGTSYGTLLGAVYANLFPDRVRAMVLDSALDPRAWSTGRTPRQRALPPFLRTGSDLASARALDAFLERCAAAGPAACAFAAGDADATRARFAALLERLRRGPLAPGTPAREVTYAFAVSTVASMLYTAAPLPGVPDSGWAALGVWLQELWTAPDAPPAPAPPPAPDAAPAPASPQAPVSPRAGAAPGALSGQVQTLGALCADTVNPPAGADYPALAALAETRSGAVGPFWVWQTQRCASWPSRAGGDRYDGPWDRRTAAPVLVVANTGDPAWPYEGSRAMADTLAGARLLTVDGYGHTVLGNPSACAAGAQERYLVEGRLPARGTLCAPDRRP
ncbi:alpha/beta fold hydrolase, partial [Kitasatospora sp. NPDC057512]|uniref:alpha/beta fold hydrolase n=1 Tax=Kitasatospora sp. NPDC057512 TaxID=3346154 RepID=UPI0036C77DDB